MAATLKPTGRKTRDMVELDKDFVYAFRTNAICTGTHLRQYLKVICLDEQDRIIGTNFDLQHRTTITVLLIIALPAELCLNMILIPART